MCYTTITGDCAVYWIAGTHLTVFSTSCLVFLAFSEYKYQRSVVIIMDWVGIRLLWMWWWTCMFHDIFSVDYKHCADHFIPPGILKKWHSPYFTVYDISDFFNTHVWRTARKGSLFYPNWSGALQKACIFISNFSIHLLFFFS